LVALALVAVFVAVFVAALVAVLVAAFVAVLVTAFVAVLVTAFVAVFLALFAGASVPAGLVAAALVAVGFGVAFVALAFAVAFVALGFALAFVALAFRVAFVMPFAGVFLATTWVGAAFFTRAPLLAAEVAFLTAIFDPLKDGIPSHARTRTCGVRIGPSEAVLNGKTPFWPG
jgi:hypothetical protein